MPDTNANLSFLPWAREGAAATIATNNIMRISTPTGTATSPRPDAMLPASKRHARTGGAMRRAPLLWVLFLLLGTALAEAPWSFTSFAISSRSASTAPFRARQRRAMCRSRP